MKNVEIVDKRIYARILDLEGERDKIIKELSWNEEISVDEKPYYYLCVLDTKTNQRYIIYTSKRVVDRLTSLIHNYDTKIDNIIFSEVSTMTILGYWIPAVENPKYFYDKYNEGFLIEDVFYESDEEEDNEINECPFCKGDGCSYCQPNLFY